MYKVTRRVADPTYSRDLFMTKTGSVGYFGEGLKPNSGDPRYDTFQKWSKPSRSDMGNLISDYFLACSRISGTPWSDAEISHEGELPSLVPEFLGWRYSEFVKDFKKLCHEGVIVANQLDVCEFLLTPGKKATVISESVPRAYAWGIPYSKYSAFLENSGLNKMIMFEQTGQVGRWGFQGGKYFLPYQTYIPYYRTVTESLSGSPVPERAAAIITEFIVNQRALDYHLITECTADANDNEFDILTEMAEFPELVRSILDGFNALADLAKAAKRREFQITQSFEKRRERIMRRRYKEYLQRRTKGRYRVDPYHVWSSKNDRRTRQETTIEVNDALAKVRLTTSYTILPTVYSIQDAISAFERFDSVYRTTRKRKISVVDAPEIPGYRFEGECEVTRRCWIKRSYVLDSKIKKWAAVLSADVLVTAWDKIPLWSIIIDWFASVGPFLKAIPWNPRYDQNKSTYSTKVKLQGRYVSVTDSSEYFEVDGSSYLRDKINPTEYIGIYYNNDFDSKKAQDLAAFIWVKIRGLSIRTKEKV